MKQAQGFLAAIREAPDDDTTRLVFSDWLEEQGEPARAELIRVQCELVRTPTWEARYPDLHVRQLELLAEHEVAWLGEWAERLVRWEYRRGLLHSVTITPEVFLVHGEALFAEHPVERVALVNQQGESLEAEVVAEVVAAQAMGEVRALETAGCRRDEPLCGMYGGRVATNAWLSALAGAEHVGRLEELHLNGDTRSGRDSLDLRTWGNFCRAGHLRTLRRIDLSDAYRHDEFDTVTRLVRALGQASFVENLRAISLASCYVGDEAARLLAASPLRRLEELDLARCSTLGPDGLGALLSAEAFPRLRTLAIPYARDLGELGEATFLGQLRSLRLSGDTHGGTQVSRGSWTARLGRRVADREWTALFQSPHLRNLTVLSVGATTTVPAEAVAVLLQAAWVANLQELNLAYEGLSLEALAPLFARPVEGPTPLYTLSLPDCDGIGEALASWPGLAGLTELNLACMYGQDCEDDTALLLDSSYLSPRLERLDLSGSCKTLRNVEQLANSPALVGLRRLVFGWNEFDQEKIQRLVHGKGLRHLEALHFSSEYLDDLDMVEPLTAAIGSRQRARLRDVVFGSGTDRETLTLLREHLGPRLRIWSDC